MQRVKGILNEEAAAFFEVLNETLKRFNTSSKVQKQKSVVLEPTSQIFTSHAVWKKQYLISYVQAFTSGTVELSFAGLVEFINPDAYNNGVFIVSKYQPDMNGFANGHDTSEFSNEVLDEEQSFFFTDGLKFSVETKQVVNCGTIFSSKDIYAIGKRKYHGNIGTMEKHCYDFKHFKPMSVFEARNLSALYAHVFKSNKDKLCRKPMLMHCFPQTPKVTTWVIFPDYNDNDEKEYTLKILQITDEDTLAQETMRGGATYNAEEVTYSASYDILSDIRMETMKTNPSEETSLKVTFFWNGSSKQMELKPPHSAKAVLQVQIAVGEPQSPLNEIYLELTTLDSIANYQSSTHRSFNSRSSSEFDKIYEDLAEFKETASEFSCYDDTNNPKDDDHKDFEKPMSQLIQKSFQRKDYDFTDKLWLFLSRVENYEEMKNCLDDVLNDIIQGTLQPAVSPLNNTKLAKFIRKLYLEENDEAKMGIKEKILDFLSSDQSIINLIVSVGFEKMKKDYFNFFLNNELAMLHNLQELHKQPKNSPTVAATDISLLWKLHYCLEIITIPAIYLQIDQDCQQSLLGAALDYYSETSVGVTSPVFCFSLLPVQDSSFPLYDSCKSRHPKIWKRGSLKENKCGLKEACIRRIVSNDIVPESDAGDVSLNFEAEVKNYEHRMLREQILLLPSCT